MDQAVGRVRDWSERVCERVVQCYLVRVSVCRLLSLLIKCRSFIGYSNANYALSEVRDPVRTIKRAAPLAMLSVSAIYLFINVAYFAVVSKDDILGSRRIVAFVICIQSWICMFIVDV